MGSSISSEAQSSPDQKNAFRGLIGLSALFSRLCLFFICGTDYLENEEQIKKQPAARWRQPTLDGTGVRGVRSTMNRRFDTASGTLQRRINAATPLVTAFCNPAMPLVTAAEWLK